MKNSDSVVEVDAQLAWLAHRSRLEARDTVKRGELLLRKADLLYEAGRYDTSADSARAAVECFEQLRNHSRLRHRATFGMAVAMLAVFRSTLANGHVSEVSLGLLETAESLLQNLARLGYLRTEVQRALELLIELRRANQEVINSLGSRWELTRSGTVDGSFNEASTLEAAIGDIATRISSVARLLYRPGVNREVRNDLVDFLRRETERALSGALSAGASIGEAAVLQAEERGNDLRRKVWESEEMLSPDQLPPALEGGRLQVLALPHPDDAAALVLPSWQFEVDPLLMNRMMQILDSFPAWAKWRFFTCGSPVLLEMSPLELLGIKEMSKSSRQLFEHLPVEPAVIKTLLEQAAIDYVAGYD